MNSWRILCGDVRERLAELPAGSVRCCVTSPPYWGLRDYGHAGQLGLESTPDLYTTALVDVFRAVGRVLADDGTVWLNLGDSYAGGTLGRNDMDDVSLARRSAQFGTGRGPGAGPREKPRARSAPPNMKAKDLVGIPWMVAKALRDPYYAGTIRDEIDRSWLAAMIDAEGSISLNLLRAGPERARDSFSVSVRVHNTSRAIVERCAEIAKVGTVSTPDSRNRPVFMWAVYGDNARAILREIYPYFVAKQHEARLACGPACEAAYEGLKLLHQGMSTTADAPIPASMLEPGWYLRSDIIWSKPNPMPESVTDRPTKAHEYIFLLSKSQRYFYDADAIKEEGVGRTDLGNMNISARLNSGAPWMNGIKDDWGRNKRSVWNVATHPYPDAHFATFPEALIEPCILAGSAHGDTILDPFTGSGTTGAVAIRHQRSFVGVELNPAYVQLARKRIGAVAPLLAREVA